MRKVLWGLTVLIAASATAYFMSVRSQLFKVADVCIQNVESVELVQSGPDFLIVSVEVEQEEYRAYVGNHPQMDPDVSVVDGIPGVYVKGQDVFKEYDQFFPSVPPCDGG